MGRIFSYLTQLLCGFVLPSSFGSLAALIKLLVPGQLSRVSHLMLLRWRCSLYLARDSRTGHVTLKWAARRMCVYLFLSVYVCVCKRARYSREWSVKSQLEFEFECDMIMAISYAINNTIILAAVLPFSLFLSPIFVCLFFALPIPFAIFSCEF